MVRRMQFRYTSLALGLVMMLTSSCTKAANRTRRGGQRGILKPGELFRCAVFEDKLFSLRSTCQRNFEIQASRHLCATHRLTLTKTDRQISLMEKFVASLNIQKLREEAAKCQKHRSLRNERLQFLRTKLAIAQKEHKNLLAIKEDKGNSIVALKETRFSVEMDNVWGRNRTSHVRSEVVELRESLKRLQGNMSQSRIHAASHIAAFQNYVREEHSLRLRDCLKEMNETLTMQTRCSTMALPTLLKSVSTNNQLEYTAASLRYNFSVCKADKVECTPQISACQQALEEAKDEKLQMEKEVEHLSIVKNACRSDLRTHESDLEQCERKITIAQEAYEKKLVNVTVLLTLWKAQKKGVDACKASLLPCKDGLLDCMDYRSILKEYVSGCFKELDTWKYQTELCQNEVTMLVDNKISTLEFIDEMEGKIEEDSKTLLHCQDAQREIRSDLEEIQKRLVNTNQIFTRKRDSTRKCYRNCPHLEPGHPGDDGGPCPAHTAENPWFYRETGCYLVTRPSASKSRMQSYCGEQASGATIATLRSKQMALDALTAIEERYNLADEDEAIRHHRRAWVELEEGFRFSARPEASYQCAETECECWTLHHHWRDGRAQRYPCQLANLPAVCFLPAKMAKV